MKKLLLSALSPRVLFFYACKKDIELESGVDNTGRITGTIKAPNNTTTIPNALLFIDVDGEIYYTTFHNHPGGNNNPQMEDIMEWVILNM